MAGYWEWMKGCCLNRDDLKTWKAGGKEIECDSVEMDNGKLVRKGGSSSLFLQFTIIHLESTSTIA